jgi:amidase
MTAPLFIPKNRSFHFDARLPAALEVDPGAVVTFETSDRAYERLAEGESVNAIGDEEYNAVTGPVVVRGAEPGDALRIDILDVAISRAWLVWLPEFGPLGDLIDEILVREVAIDGDRLVISDQLHLPLEPMIGCIGLAPAKGRSSTNAPAYAWGGNMDLRELSAGATLYLPVQTPGAFLFVGDLHAAMGQGEPAVVGLEASGRATVRVDVDKGMNLSAPRIRAGRNTICVGLGEGPRGLREAKHSAILQAYELLTREWRLDQEEAYAYVCARVELRVGGPACSIVLAVVPDR